MTCMCSNVSGPVKAHKQATCYAPFLQGSLCSSHAMSWGCLKRNMQETGRGLGVVLVWQSAVIPGTIYI
jgi:hypothetical protein